MGVTKIEWATHSVNPLLGCERVSEGCANCYAERMARRLAAMGRGAYGMVANSNGWNGRCVGVGGWEERLPKKGSVFVNSMGDLFYGGHSFAAIKDVFDVCARHRDCVFFVLTKRAKRMYEFCRHFYADGVPNNIWMGVSVENRDYLFRVRWLLMIEAVVRFMSVEPMIGPIKCLPDVDWVICGCETGGKRRVCDIEWMRRLKDLCVEAEIPFFLKQREINGKVEKIPMLDGRVWDYLRLDQIGG